MRTVFVTRAIVLVIGAAASSDGLVAQSVGRKDRADVFIKDVSVFSPEGGAWQSHCDIVVAGTRIAAIAPTGQLSPRAKTVVRGSGKFVVPGLFDNHVHFARLTNEAAGLFLASGVTTVRDMGTDPRRVAEWRTDLDRGKVLGPRIARACGPMLERGGEQRVDHWVVQDATAADSIAKVLAGLGLDCMKLRTYKDSATYIAIAEAARRHGLDLVGHAPEALPPLVALAAGQRTFEHGFYPYPLSKLSAEDKAATLAAFKSYGSALVPTLVAWLPAAESLATLRRRLATEEHRSEYRLPEALLLHWAGSLEAHERLNRGSPGWQSAVRTAARDIGEMFRAGIIVLPGSDTGAPFVSPGVGLLEELELLVSRAGLSPADVLSAATLGSARFHHLDRDLGSVEVGKIADLIVLDRDPLTSIENVRSLDAVVFRGEILTRAQLNILQSRTLPSTARR